MTEEIKTCPLCGNRESLLFDRRIFKGQPVTNKICTACGLVFQSPRMTETELNVYYQSEYRLSSQGSEGPIRKDLIIQRKRAELVLAFAQPLIKSVTRHLDIGSSAGLVLQRFQQTYACHPVGVEPGRAYREYAQKRGVEVFASLDQVLELHQPFDLISMLHVLEHLPDPVSYLERLRQQVLAPSGWLLIEVPNLYAHDSFETAHLFSFSAHTLEQVLRKAGYEILAVRKQGLPRSQILPLYINMLARPASADGRNRIISVQPDRGVLAKRKLGMLYRRFATRLVPGKAFLPVEE